jgi:5-methylcytosine-specific restriction endonuclease McrA
MKECNKCKEIKSKTSFYLSKSTKDGYEKMCKECHIKNYYTPTPNKKICRVCSVGIDNQNGINSGHKRKDNSIIYQSICKTCEKGRRNNYQKDRRIKDPIFKLYGNVRSRINSFLKSNKKTTLLELGCDLFSYKQYLESKFDDNMNWGNYGTYWEIDHIVPLSKGGIFHYTNTQPLTKHQNRSKRNKI